jgi:hypothetical protein
MAAAAASGSPEMVEHHRRRPDLADRIGDALAGDVRRRAVHRLEQRGELASGLMLPEGAMPMVPVQAGPRSDRMSPNRLEATTTSKRVRIQHEMRGQDVDVVLVPWATSG